MTGNVDDAVGYGGGDNPLRATSIVGVGSLMTLVLGLLASKAYALLVGPSGLGLLALLQSLMNFGLILGGFGLATSLIRAAASASVGGQTQVGTVTSAGIWVAASGGLIVGCALVALSQPVAQLITGSATQSGQVAVVGISVAVGVLGIAQIAVLTGLKRIKSVALVNVLTSLVAALFGIGIIATIGEAGFSLVLLVAAITQATIAWVVLRRLGLTIGVTDRPSVLGAMRRLIRVGPAITGSQMASTGAQLAIPLILLAMLTAADVGLFRAVATISVGYLTFFLASLTQDYLPRISQPNTPVTLGILLENRMRLVIGLGLPLILALFAGASLLLEILYSSDFVVATDLLRWYLIGDLVRLPAWVLAFTLLARGQAEYFAVELAGGILLLGSTVLAVSAFGFVGAGIAYAAAQLGYFGLVWILVRRSVVTTPGRLQLVVLLAMAGCTALLLTETHPLVIAVVSASASVVTASAAWHRLSRRAQVGQL